jgi:hypothetical protein
MMRIIETVLLFTQMRAQIAILRTAELGEYRTTFQILHAPWAFNRLKRKV